MLAIEPEYRVNVPIYALPPLKCHNLLEIVLHILKLVLLGLKTIITNPKLELIGYEQRPIAALIKSFIISNLTYNVKVRCPKHAKKHHDLLRHWTSNGQSPDLGIRHCGLRSVRSSPYPKTVIFVSRCIETTIFKGNGELFGELSSNDSRAIS